MKDSKSSQISSKTTPEHQQTSCCQAQQLALNYQLSPSKQEQASSLANEAREQLRRLQKMKQHTQQKEQSRQTQQELNQKQLSQKSKQSLNNQTFLDTSQYKTLHDKLDSIQSKIGELQKNIAKQQQQQQTNYDRQTDLKALVTQEPQHSGVHYFTKDPYSQQENLYYVSELVRAYKDQRSLARDHLNSTLHILKLIDMAKKPSAKEMKKLEVSVPLRQGYQGKKTVVFDLDETLVHCNYSASAQYDVRLPIKTTNGEVIEAGINVRPYARQILCALSKHFQIIVFTASHSSYANVVIDYLDQKNQWVHHRLFRQHCLISPQGMYIKDLRVINRDLKDLILVDNAAYSYAYQLQNAVPILPYYHGQVDFELKKLEDYLMKLCQVRDVREENEKMFKLSLYRNYLGKPEALVEQLYMAK